MQTAQTVLELANRKRREFVAHRNADVPSEIQVVEGAACRDQALAPELSVVIPTRDADCHGNFAKLLEDIRRQSFQRCEVIIVKGDTRQGRAINTGAALARGDVLLTLDDDARLGDEHVFERLADVMRAHPEIGMAGVPNLIPEGASWLARAVMEQVPRKRATPVQDITDSDLAEHGCLAIRKSVFYQVGGEHEWLPRGLDPYLRSAVRNAGYRVVVIPDAWYHHLPPRTMRGLVKQAFRNGVQAAYCQKFFPQWVIETPARHVSDFPERLPFPRRVVRYAGRLLRALVTLRWVYLFMLVIYVVGYGCGFVTAKREGGRPSG